MGQVIAVPVTRPLPSVTAPDGGVIRSKSQQQLLLMQQRQQEQLEAEQRQQEQQARQQELARVRQVMRDPGTVCIR